VPREQVEEWRARDPIERQERRLREAGVDVEAVRGAVSADIEGAEAQALAGPMPVADDVLEGVFCTGEAVPLGDGVAPWSGFAAGGGA
jgi:TPP-dependent pyruvate/acetoin dehydrogenase alpha subunit